MTQNKPLNHGQIAHEGFFDPIQEMLGAHVGNGFRLERVNTTTIKVAASTENGQVTIAVQGRYRYRTTETTAVLPGGLPNGEHPVFVTASDNDYSGPIEDPDAPTVYTFGLEIKESGKTPATALYREVGKVTVTGGAITAIRQTVGSVSGAQIENGALSSESGSDITWTREANGAWVPVVKNLAVTAAKLAANAVEEAKIADGAVSSRKAKLTVGKAEGGSVVVGTEKTLVVPVLELVLPVKSHVFVWPLLRRASSTKGLADAFFFVDTVEKGFIGTLAESTVAEAANAQGSFGGSIVLENLAAGTRKLEFKAQRGTTTCTSLASYFTYMVVAAA